MKGFTQICEKIMLSFLKKCILNKKKKSFRTLFENGDAYGILLIRSLRSFKLYIKQLNSCSFVKMREFREKQDINEI